MGADRILIDERRGYRAAKDRGLKPVGLLGVLYAAAGQELIELPTVLQKLTTQTNFRCDRKLIAELMRRDTARQAQKNP